MVEASEIVLNNLERFSAFANAYDVSGLNLVGGDVNDFSVYDDMAMEHDLTGSGAGGSDTETVNDVVETRFEELDEDFTGDTFHARSLVEEVAELTLENAVSVFHFLLFAELSSVLRRFAATVLTVLAGGIITALEHFILSENRFAEFTGDFRFGACISCHFILNLMPARCCLYFSAAATIER